MKTGTTPTHNFEMPYNLNMLTDVRVIYSQDGNVILKKRLSDCKTDRSTNTLSLTLTQEETFMFTPHTVVEIQLRAVVTNGNVLASDIYEVPVERCLDSEVLV